MLDKVLLQIHLRVSSKDCLTHNADNEVEWNVHYVDGGQYHRTALFSEHLCTFSWKKQKYADALIKHRIFVVSKFVLLTW